MAPAINSLPVPDSPWISPVPLLAATNLAWRKIAPLGLQLLQGLFTRGGADDLIALFFQDVLKEGQGAHVVVNNQNPLRCCFHLPDQNQLRAGLSERADELQQVLRDLLIPQGLFLKLPLAKFHKRPREDHEAGAEAHCTAPLA